MIDASITSFKANSINYYLLIKDLRKCGYTDMFGEKDPFMYILKFIEKNWEQDIVKVENWEQFWEQYLRSDDEY